MSLRIYLDHNAASIPDPKVVDAVEHYLRHSFGNPSSMHSFGREARGILTKARDFIAKYLSVKPREIIFNSGGTEGANMVIYGILQREKKGHIITTGAEHSSVYTTIKEWEKRGFAVTYLPVGEYGAVKKGAVFEALRPETKLIAIMSANNETGVKTDIEAIASFADSAGVPFFVDGVATLGKERFTIPSGVSAMSFSGQKIHALQGSGFCFVRKNLKLSPQITGGGQQFSVRSGTENVPGIVGLAKAVELLQEDHFEKMRRQRDFFEDSLQKKLGEVFVNGKGPRVANTSNLCFLGIDGESLLTALDLNGLAASHGSACESGALEPSRVLLNMGLSRERVLSSLRFSFSRFTTDEEVDSAVQIITQTALRLRSF